MGLDWRIRVWAYLPSFLPQIDPFFDVYQLPRIRNRKSQAHRTERKRESNGYKKMGICLSVETTLCRGCFQEYDVVVGRVAYTLGICVMPRKKRKRKRKNRREAHLQQEELQNQEGFLHPSLSLSLSLSKLYCRHLGYLLFIHLGVEVLSLTLNLSFSSMFLVIDFQFF